mmetsp:Transcript_55813/g.126848  ORF Transcript_55813/g.126848 Transcript_55813/m.126848 type:complete len:284 (+) Transcript_55813:2302-3153(+)
MASSPEPMYSRHHTGSPETHTATGPSSYRRRRPAATPSSLPPWAPWALPGQSAKAHGRQTLEASRSAGSEGAPSGMGSPRSGRSSGTRDSGVGDRTDLARYFTVVVRGFDVSSFRKASWLRGQVKWVSCSQLASMHSPRGGSLNPGHLPSPALTSWKVTRFGSNPAFVDSAQRSRDSKAAALGCRTRETSPNTRRVAPRASPGTVRRRLPVPKLRANRMGWGQVEETVAWSVHVSPMAQSGSESMYSNWRKVHTSSPARKVLSKVVSLLCWLGQRSGQVPDTV